MVYEPGTNLKTKGERYLTLQTIIFFFSFFRKTLILTRIVNILHSAALVLAYFTLQKKKKSNKNTSKWIQKYIQKYFKNK